MSAGGLIEFAARCLLVGLFLPFSALDKIFNFRGAVAQAELAVLSSKLAAGLILVGLAVEIFMPLGIVTGIADHLAAFVLGGYCVVTALLWKQFWRADKGTARDLFWDFLKNFSLAGGFMLLAFGTSSASVNYFLAHPLASSHPYETGNH
jgi:putative oxidoreductase